MSPAPRREARDTSLTVPPAPGGRMHGGLRLDGHKQRSTRRPLRAAGESDMYVLPLDQHVGAPATPRVRPGESVLTGQVIGEAAGAWLHSPVSGIVKAIELRPAAQHLGAPTLSVVIANDGRDRRGEYQTKRSFEQYSPRELCEHIGRGGIVGLGGGAFPAASKLLSAPIHTRRATTGDRPTWLLLNAMECEPYISCDDMLLREHARDVLLGASILMHAIGARHCTIALEDDTPQAEQAVREALAEAADERIRIVILPRRYPAGSERQLIETLFGIEVPFDGLPADVGVICQNVGTAAAAARWLRDGEPLIRRIVTVTGDGVREPADLEVLLGTPIATLIEDCGGYTPRMSRLIMGGSMMGVSLPHDALPIIKASQCIIAASSLDLQPRSAEMPCIRCGDCAQVCPARLLPQQLHWHVHMENLEAAGNLEALERHGLMDCIECGCCDYVCPSQIPLVERFREAKPALERARMQPVEAAAARARFQARNVRLARLEEEHRARLAAKRRRPGEPRSG
ncbi:electron transporter RnfC [Steroidobacter denitrificans]|uniref:Ion-translocating oxidoreductase complex subunit C n=1 Tax=Steroidobacter denitrificans TaxID=465721 RepID=A0A127F7C0_STEDE|nr:electron transport complex subunit RsxC [Steroidobacter denitrificans]AMN46297.1 electron transporter RnfC [Steroidobacter denitrificans]